MNELAQRIRDEIFRLFGPGRELALRPLDLATRFGGEVGDVEAALRSLTDEGAIEVVKYWNPHDAYGRFWINDTFGNPCWLGGYEYTYDAALDDLAWYVSGPDLWIRIPRVPVEV